MAILYGTLSPSKSLPKVDFLSKDKFLHYLVFVIWTFLYGVTHAAVKKGRPKLLVVFGFGLFYGLLIEILQLALPTNRHPELLDFIADGLGAATAIFLLHWAFQFFRFEDTNT